MDSEHETSETERPAEAEPSSQPLGPGEKLRAARAAKGVDIASIAAETRIREHHLEAIENEAFEDLPSRAYAIGFARSYARAVGLDEAEITDAVRERMADESERRAIATGGMEPGDPAKLPSAGLAWFGAFAAILLAAGVYAFYNTYYATGGGLGSLLTSEENAQAGGEMASADGEGDSAAAINPNGQVVFTALDDEIWVRFFVEGGDVLFEDTMERGESYEVPRDLADVRLNTGRPQFLQITIDGEAVPKLAEEQVTLVEPVSAAALLARFAPASEGSTAPQPTATPRSNPSTIATNPAEPDATMNDTSASDPNDAPTDQASPDIANPVASPTPPSPTPTGAATTEPVDAPSPAAEPAAEAPAQPAETAAPADPPPPDDDGGAAD